MYLTPYCRAALITLSTTQRVFRFTVKRYCEEDEAYNWPAKLMHHILYAQWAASKRQQGELSPEIATTVESPQLTLVDSVSDD